MVRVDIGICSRASWYDRQESVGPGRSTSASSDASPCSMYDSVSPPSMVTLDASAAIPREYVGGTAAYGGAMPLKPGDKAPAIALLDQSGNKVKLSDFKGRKV